MRVSEQLPLIPSARLRAGSNLLPPGEKVLWKHYLRGADIVSENLRDKYCIAGVGGDGLYQGLRAEHPVHGCGGDTQSPGRRRASRPRRGRDDELSHLRLHPLHHGDVRPGHTPQLLHGRLGRRLQHRSPDGPGYGRHRSGDVPHGGYLSLHERLLGLQVRRHRRAGGCSR